MSITDTILKNQYIDLSISWEGSKNKEENQYFRKTQFSHILC